MKKAKRIERRRQKAAQAASAPLSQPATPSADPSAVSEALARLRRQDAQRPEPAPHPKDPPSGNPYRWRNVLAGGLHPDDQLVVLTPRRPVPVLRLGDLPDFQRLFALREAQQKSVYGPR